MSRLTLPLDLLASLGEPLETRRLDAAIDRVPRESRFLVAGMRRSGNHAVIGWLANALQADVDPLTYEWMGVGISASGNTVHLNDITTVGLKPRGRRAKSRGYVEISPHSTKPRDSSSVLRMWNVDRSTTWVSLRAGSGPACW